MVNGKNGKIISLEAKRLEREQQKLKESYERVVGRAAAKTRSTGIPSQSEYERRERMEAIRREQEVERAPLRDRKEAQQSFLEAMRERPAIVASRIGWLLDGNYGYGPMVMAKQVLGSPRMNREAALTQMIAVHEWMVPRRMAAEAWKKLTSAEKASLSEAVAEEIREAEEEARG
jgi:hypothetical protein